MAPIRLGLLSKASDSAPVIISMKSTPLWPSQCPLGPLLAIAARFDWHLHHFDVIGAFLNAPVKEVIYIDSPENGSNS